MMKRSGRELSNNGSPRLQQYKMVHQPICSIFNLSTDFMESCWKPCDLKPVSIESQDISLLDPFGAFTHCRYLASER